MQVYLYDSLDGDTQVFSTMEKALEYSREMGYSESCEQQDENLWLVFDGRNESVEIRLATIDKPE